MSNIHINYKSNEQNINVQPDALNEENNEWKQLYKILKYDRNKIKDFLINNNSYNYLRNLLEQIEKHKITEKDSNIIMKLFLGQVGLEINKQRALYEMPTNELLTIIKFLCEYLNINNVEELIAGQGLLSSLIKHKLGNNYNVTSTDGNRWIETNCSLKYYDVTNKLLLKYCVEDNNFNDTLLIAAWLPSNDINDFILFLTLKKPKYLIILGNTINNTNYVKVRNELDTLNYNCVNIKCKQLCYKDYFLINKQYPNEYCKSSLLFATLDENINIKKMMLTLKLKHKNCLATKLRHFTDKMIIQDFVYHSGFPSFLLNISENENQAVLLLELLNNIKSHNMTVPYYLKNYSELKFWFNKSLNARFPLKINERAKFIEYKEYLRTINSSGGISTLKENGILPSWVNNTDTAEKFIWLEFSSDRKKWKDSRYEFNQEFSRIYGRNNNNNNLQVNTLNSLFQI